MDSAVVVHWGGLKTITAFANWATYKTSADGMRHGILSLSAGIMEEE